MGTPWTQNTIFTLEICSRCETDYNGSLLTWLAYTPQWNDRQIDPWEIKLKTEIASNSQSSTTYKTRVTAAMDKTETPTDTPTAILAAHIISNIYWCKSTAPTVTDGNRLLVHRIITHCANCRGRKSSWLSRRRKTGNRLGRQKPNKFHATRQKS